MKKYAMRIAAGVLACAAGLHAADEDRPASLFTRLGGMPAVNAVVDGFVGMEGPGPSGGDPVKMDLVVAGRDIVATDVVATRVMGFDPRSIRHISMAIERGLGSWDHEIVGDDLESVRGSFRPP